MREGLRDELGPVFDGAGEGAAVYVGVGGHGQRPGVFEVVDEEADVGRDPGGLDGREVDAGYGAVGVGVAAGGGVSWWGMGGGRRRTSL